MLEQATFESTTRPRGRPTRRAFEAQFVGRSAPNPQGTTNSFRRDVRISLGSESRDVELVVTRWEIGAAGLSVARMRDPSLWRDLLAGIEEDIDGTCDSLDDIPDELTGRCEHLSERT